MHGLALNAHTWPFPNGTITANARFHMVLPIGVVPGYPRISGYDKLWVVFKSINGAAVTGTPSFVGAMWAHLYEERTLKI
jgi:hypothetical protein